MPDQAYVPLVLLASLVILALAVGLPSTDACEVGEITPQACGGCCCTFSDSNHTYTTSFDGVRTPVNVTYTTACYSGGSAAKICEKLSGTCGGAGTCNVGTYTEQDCDGNTPCCCEYAYDGMDASICVSSQLCSSLSGSCSG
eukprot:TRINITY_DN12620_c0_g1_i1.p1 TRINITY_DN12620_c0_g1~~TRINITY_DN12620_c0_g1_i1.p1  ORF type:complete len:157 (+),score=2.18 TRINITY_DN12620_c0_g1_i1:47-472(+)